MLLYKKEIEVIFKALRDTAGVLSFAESRIRDAVIKELITHVNELNTAKNDIFKKFADTSTELPGGQVNYHFPPESVESVTHEVNILLDETVEVDERFVTFIDKTTYKPEYGEVEIIDVVVARVKHD